MIEIFALVYLTRKIGVLAERKGLKPGTWKLITVLTWFGFEIIGLLIGFAIFGWENTISAVLVGLPCAFGGYHFIKHTLENKPDVDNGIDSIGQNLEY